MPVKKFMITIVGENPVGIDEVFEALEKVITDYFSVHENETDELRTRNARDSHDLEEKANG